jgi:hypothetical protein
VQVTGLTSTPTTHSSHATTKTSSVTKKTNGLGCIN